MYRRSEYNLCRPQYPSYTRLQQNINYSDICTSYTYITTTKPGNINTHHIPLSQHEYNTDKHQSTTTSTQQIHSNIQHILVVYHISPKINTLERRIQSVSETLPNHINRNLTITTSTTYTSAQTHTRTVNVTQTH